jgi:hypothetical protein
MKHNSVVIMAKPAPLPFSSQKNPNSRRLCITPWQTHSWTKKIIKIRGRLDTWSEIQTLSKPGNVPSRLFSFL